MFYQQKESGFTLIELLVVIAIIGLLASVVLVSLNSARVKARDAKRITDLKQLATAMNLYYADNNFMPGCLGSGCDTRNAGGCTTIGNSTYGFAGSAAYQPLLTKYMSKIPADPLYGAAVDGDYMYNWAATDANAGKFTLCASLEQGQGNVTPYIPCAYGPILYNYCVSQ